jgi:hypothetical protein
MPIRLRAVQHAAHGAPITSSAHVWISDDLLQASINAFTAKLGTRACRRHGSNVPGPLEARRRLAKRKLGHLAVSGGYGAPHLDPAVAFGWFGNRGYPSAQPELRWSPPGADNAARKGKHTYPKLPAWLDVKHPASDSGAAKTLNALQFEPVPLADSVTWKDYKARIATAHNLDGIRNIIEELGSAVKDVKQCSTLAFERLRSIYKDHHDLGKQRDSPELGKARLAMMDFLQDERLERSNGRNLLQMLKMLEDEPISMDEFAILCGLSLEILSRSADLPGTSWRPAQIARHILALGARTASSIPDSDLLFDLCSKVWTWCRTREPREMQDLPAELFSHVVGLHLSDDTSRLATDIVCHYRPSGIRMLYGTERQIQEFRAEKEKYGSWLNSLACFARKLIDDHRQALFVTAAAHESTYLVSFVQALPRDWIPKGTAILTLALVDDLRAWTESKLPLERLRVWTGNIPADASFSSDTVANMFTAVATTTKPSEAAFLFTGLTGHEICRLLLRYWLPLSIYAGVKAPQIRVHKENQSKSVDLAWRKSRQWLERASGHYLNPDQIAFASLAYAAHSHGMHWELVLKDVLELPKQFNRPQDIDAIARGFRKLHHWNCLTISHRHILSTYISETSNIDAYSALRVFNLDRRLFLSQFPDLALDCVASPSVEANNIVDLLRQHDRHAELIPFARQHHPACKLSPDRVDLTHNLALAFANSGRFTCRAASSSVFFCWKYLRDNLAPIDDRMAKAIIMTSILKPIAANEWIPKAQMNWAFRVVRAMHGTEAAAELDLNAWELRAKRQYAMLPYKMQEGMDVEQDVVVDWSLLPSRRASQRGFVGPKNLAVKERRRRQTGPVTCHSGGVMKLRSRDTAGARAKA